MKKIEADIVPVQQVTDQDVTNFIDWVWRQRKINMFDPDVLAYPRACMCRAYSGDEMLLYIPLQPVLMWDAIAAKPGLPPKQEALALWRIGQEVDKAMEMTGIREAYFLTSDDRVADLCARHGFEEVRGVRLLKKKAPKTKQPEISAISEPVIEKVQ